MASYGDRGVLSSHLDVLGIPHASTIQELAARYGVKDDRYGWPAVHLDGAGPLVPHQSGPMTCSPERNPDLLPPPVLSAHARIGDDARQNHAATLAALTPILGEPRDTSTTNTVEHTWAFDTASLTIRAFPPELQSVRLTNPSHDRDPELRTMCHVSIRPGHVPPLSPSDLERMRDAEPLRVRAPRMDLPPDILLGSARRVPEELRRAEPVVGISRDGGAIVGLGPRIGFVVEALFWRAMVLHRFVPARGPGGAQLELEYADAFSSDGTLRRRTLADSDAVDGLDELAADLSRRLAIPLTVEETLDD